MTNRKKYYPDHTDRQFKFKRGRQAANSEFILGEVIDPIRKTARKLGYSVAVHGSMVRDIDLVAIPWTDKAVSQEKVAEAIRAEIEKICKWGLFIHGEEGTEKPHGRRAWLISVFSCEVDLSVLPPTPSKDTKET